MKKLGKAKILISVLCLAAALTLAVFTVYAWFVQFTQVKANGVDSVITSGDVLTFAIDYYYTSSEDGEEYDIGDKIEPDTKDGDKLKMHKYEPSLSTSGATETAVLVDLKLTFSKTGTFNLTAKTSSTAAYDDSTFDNFIENNYLSNIIYLRKIDTITPYQTFTISSGDEYPDQLKFVTGNFDGKDDNDKKKPSIELPEYTTTPLTFDSDGKQIEQHIYYLIDYMPQQINSIYTLLLQKFDEATLTTGIFFQHDIFFEIGKSDTD